MLFNYHTHTKRCNHAQGDEREYVEHAITSGLKTLGFSDHAPYLFPNSDYQSSFRMKQDELFAYADTVRALAKEYEKDIRILCGFELEYYPDFHKQEMAFLSQVQPDYLLLGQHFVGNEFSRLPSSGIKTDDIALTLYVTQVLAGLATGDFLYLAHPDIAGVSCSPEAVDREYRRLCEGAKRMGVPLEINFLGIRDKRRYPNDKFFKIAGEVGNAIIFGSDAHEPWVVNDTESEEIALDMAKKFNLKVMDKPLL